MEEDFVEVLFIVIVQQRHGGPGWTRSQSTEVVSSPVMRPSQRRRYPTEPIDGGHHRSPTHSRGLYITFNPRRFRIDSTILCVGSHHFRGVLSWQRLNSINTLWPH